MAWLGVDLGDARVGLALSDPEYTFAHPAGTIDAMGDSFHTLDAVIDIVERQDIDHIVIGLPLRLDGSEGHSAKKARRWADNLRKRMTALGAQPEWSVRRLPQVTLFDERLTTVSAHQQLLEADLSSRKHRSVVDQQSAVIILQSALDSRARQESQEA